MAHGAHAAALSGAILLGVAIALPRICRPALLQQRCHGVSQHVTLHQPEGGRRPQPESVIVVDGLLRDLRVENCGVYLPSSMIGTNVKVFMPLRRDYEVPARVHLAEDERF